MALPVLTPASTVSAVVLPATGTTATTGNGAGNVSNYAFGMYVDPASQLYDVNFISGASDQVAYVYHKLGGDVLDLEIMPANVFNAYEEAVLEYSYMINLHQSKNVLGDYLGATTGTFDHDGQLKEASLTGSHINLAYGRQGFESILRMAQGIGDASGIVNGSMPHYTSSIDLVMNQQDYDIQQILEDKVAADPTLPFAAALSGSASKRALIRRVYFKTPQSMWRFYGYYGGLNVVGNLNYYGQFADDTTFEIIPAWHNKLQAMAFEDHIYTRLSHYSFEIFNNKIRIFPTPDTSLFTKMWFEFTIDIGTNPWDKVGGIDNKEGGITNMNALPFDNIPFANINSIGKQWIRRYGLALVKETLGQIRSKFGSIPIPGDAVQLNGTALISEAREEQTKLKEELKTILDELTYAKLAELKASQVESAGKILEEIPLLIYQG
jgi:hypothetical protein